MSGLPELDRLRLTRHGCMAQQEPIRLPRHRRGERFLRGPIPLRWLKEAARLPGKALAVALEVWFFAGLRGQAVVSVNLSRLHTAEQIPRSTASRGLAALEEAGLVAVERKPGRKPQVTILEV
jgi:DNA-binding transcriptional ArsR family regulator